MNAFLHWSVQYIYIYCTLSAIRHVGSEDATQNGVCTTGERNFIDSCVRVLLPVIANFKYPARPIPTKWLLSTYLGQLKMLPLLRHISQDPLTLTNETTTEKKMINVTLRTFRKLWFWVYRGTTRVQSVNKVRVNNKRSAKQRRCQEAEFAPSHASEVTVNHSRFKSHPVCSWSPWSFEKLITRTTCHQNEQVSILFTYKMTESNTFFQLGVV